MEDSVILISCAIAYFGIYVLVQLLINRNKRVQFHQKYDSLIGTKGYYSSADDKFLNEQKEIRPELDNLEFYDCFWEGAFPEYLPCTIAHIQFNGKIGSYDIKVDTFEEEFWLSATLMGKHENSKGVILYSENLGLLEITKEDYCQLAEKLYEQAEQGKNFFKLRCTCDQMENYEDADYKLCWSLID